ncbi:MAG: SMI1/KNR4 family protein [Betaproteobacteria bacterium]|nr:SMI1/KNR4 family protein [Betaproteobacteria bacterium]
MNSRDEIFQQFVKKWVDAEYLPSTVNPGPLDAAERELGLLPAAYREFILRFGWVQIEQSLTNAALSAKDFLEPIYHFLAPMELSAEMRSLRQLGLKRGYVPIATNGGGDYFCLKPSDSLKGRADDSPVYFFLHEERNIGKVAPSFQEWLRSYANLSASAPA